MNHMFNSSHVIHILSLKGGKEMRVLRILEEKDSFSAKKPLIEITGTNRVLIENHLGIVKYSTEEIDIKVSYGIVCISGSNLCLMKIGKEQLIIAGSFDSLKVCRRQL